MPKVARACHEAGCLAVLEIDRYIVPGSQMLSFWDADDDYIDNLPVTAVSVQEDDLTSLLALIEEQNSLNSTISLYLDGSSSNQWADISKSPIMQVVMRGFLAPLAMFVCILAARTWTRKTKILSLGIVAGIKATPWIVHAILLLELFANFGRAVYWWSNGFMMGDTPWTWTTFGILFMSPPSVTSTALMTVFWWNTLFAAKILSLAPSTLLIWKIVLGTLVFLDWFAFFAWWVASGFYLTAGSVISVAAVALNLISAGVLGGIYCYTSVTVFLHMRKLPILSTDNKRQRVIARKLFLSVFALAIAAIGYLFLAVTTPAFFALASSMHYFGISMLSLAQIAVFWAPSGSSSQKSNLTDESNARNQVDKKQDDKDNSIGLEIDAGGNAWFE